MECLASPNGWWFHLRRCAECGDIGCCDSSPSQHVNLRFAAIRACYKEWGDKGAFFLAEPLPNPDGWGWRCYMRDPDGCLIEVGQYTELALDWFNSHS